MFHSTDILCLSRLFGPSFALYSIAVSCSFSCLNPIKIPKCTKHSESQSSFILLSWYYNIKEGNPKVVVVFPCFQTKRNRNKSSTKTPTHVLRHNVSICKVQCKVTWIRGVLVVVLVCERCCRGLDSVFSVCDKKKEGGGRGHFPERPRVKVSQSS